jgi:membrane protease YdiL (CAAX protease family)
VLLAGGVPEGPLAPPRQHRTAQIAPPRPRGSLQRVRGGASARHYRAGVMEPDGAKGLSRPARPRVQWGTGDVLIAFLIGVVASVIAAQPFVTKQGTIPHSSELAATIAAVLAQSAGVIAWLFGVSRRKGVGSMRRDFGLELRARDVWWLVGGMLIVGISTLALIPITELANLKETSQEVARVFERANGLGDKLLFTVAVVLVAPVAEELLFRGILLRSLLRRLEVGPALLISALVFALVHVVGDIGTGYYVPAYLFLGLVSGFEAVRTRSLSHSIYLHMGFNLVAAIQVLT